MNDEVITKKKYAILRFGKIRSWGTLAHVDNHNNRKVSSENLLNDTPPRELLPEGSDDFVASAKDRMSELGIPQPSIRGKVLAVETVMTASRAWFDSASDEEKDEWLERCVAWVTKKFGRGLISVKLHLDEEVWHLHAVALPLVQKVPKKRGRPHKDPDRRAESEALWFEKAPRWTLSYEDLLGGHRMNLSREQDDYHSAVADLGLERGEKTPEVVEIELGDELSIPLPEWQKGGSRKSIPPKDYRAILKDLHREAQAESASIKRQTAELAERVAAVGMRESAVEVRSGELEALQRALNDRRESLETKERDFKKREDALGLRETAVTTGERALSSARDALAETQKLIDATVEKARKDEAAAAEAKKRAVAAETAAADKQAQAEAAKAAADKKVAEVRAERALEDRQAALLARAADDANGLQIVPSGEAFAMTTARMAAAEEETYKAGWSLHLLKIGHLLAQAMQRVRSLAAAAEQKLASLLQREEALASRETAAAQAEEKAASDLTAASKKLEEAEDLRKDAEAKDRESTELRDTLNDEYKSIEKQNALLDDVAKKASAFERLWAHVPPSQRPAAVTGTLQAGEEFAADFVLYRACKDNGSGR